MPPDRTSNDFIGSSCLKNFTLPGRRRKAELQPNREILLVTLAVTEYRVIRIRNGIRNARAENPHGLKYMAVHIVIGTQKFSGNLADRLSAGQAPEDWRTPGHFAYCGIVCLTRSVLAAVLPPSGRVQAHPWRGCSQLQFSGLT